MINPSLHAQHFMRLALNIFNRQLNARETNY